VTQSHEECYRNARVLRGGSWNNNDNNLRAANRNNNEPTNRNNNVGFRCSVQYSSCKTKRRFVLQCFGVRVRKRDFTESTSRNPGNVPVLGYLHNSAKYKKVSCRLVGDERWHGTLMRTVLSRTCILLNGTDLRKEQCRGRFRLLYPIILAIQITVLFIYHI